MVTQLIILINLLNVFFPLHEDGLHKHSFKPDTLLRQDLASSKDSTKDTIPWVDEKVVFSEVFKVVEEMPQFPDGEMEMMKFIYENIKYPEQARKEGIQGVVPLQFLVETDGSLKYLKAISGPGYGTEEEALRVFQLMAESYKWIPGKQRNKNVRVRMTVPIKFALSEEYVAPQEKAIPDTIYGTPFLENNRLVRLDTVVVFYPERFEEVIQIIRNEIGLVTGKDTLWFKDIK